MAMQAERELIDNFVLELQPYLAQIDEAVEELARSEPDGQVIIRAIEALGVIRGASSILVFNGLVRLTAALEAVFEQLLNAVNLDQERLLDRARMMAAGIRRYMDALVDGDDTSELVASVLTPYEDAAAADSIVGEQPAVESGIVELVTAVTQTEELRLRAEPGTTRVPELDEIGVAETDPELRAIFEEEATDLIASYTRLALTLVSAPDRPAILAGLRRDAHTIKGAANMTGFPIVGAVAGSIETLLDAHIDEHIPIGRETMGVILSARKLLASMLASLDNLSDFYGPARALIERAKSLHAAVLPVDIVVGDSRPAEPFAHVGQPDVPTLPADVATDDEPSADEPVAESDVEVEIVAETAEEPALVDLEPDAEPTEPDVLDESEPAQAFTNAEEPATELQDDRELLPTADLEPDAVETTTETESIAAEDMVIEPTPATGAEPLVDAESVAEAEPFVEADEVIDPTPAADAGQPLDSELVTDTDLVVDDEPAIAAEAVDVIVTESVDTTTADNAPAAIEEPADEVMPAADVLAGDEPEPDVYEIAAEIAQLARLRTSLMPQNATVFPDEASDLTDDINALSAEIVEGPLPAAGVETSETSADLLLAAAADDAATDVADESPADAPLEEIDRPRFAMPYAPTGVDDLLGHALLELAFESGDAAPGPDWSIPATGPEDAPLDEQMRQELRETFAVEAAEYADALTLATMALERDPESDDALREITRILHTLKGAAAAAGFDAISDDCHSLEDSLAAGVDVGPDLLQRMLTLAHALEEQTTGDAPPIGSLLDEPLPATARSSGDLRVDLRRLDGLLNLVGELVINRATLDQRLQRLTASLDELTHMTERLRRSGQTLERVAGEASLFGPLPSMPPDDRIVALHGHDLRREFDTLEMDRYTDLDVLARELAEVAADIGAVAGEARNLRGDFETVSTHQRRLTNVIQDELMGIRMVPLASLSPLLYRVVRRVAHESGKEVELVIAGGETAFDKSLVDALSDALLHLLRNAVDHGIETPEQRERAGKRSTGRITIRAWHDRSNAVVEVIDDGGGIDTARLVERGREFGFVTSEQISDAEALQLMFLPGFTTRTTADTVSGRGVGLDAVRAAVERVKGRVTVDTKPGAGTIFQLRLPVMLAVTQAFLVEAGSRTYAIPLADVDYVADRRGARLSRVGNAALLEIGEALIPAIDLAARLAGDGDRLDEEAGWLLITRAGGEPRAIRVDALLGQQEIVVKPLGRYLRSAPGVTGATILGDGQIALIVDVVDVAGKRAVHAAPAEAAAPPVAIESARGGAGTALVVDDSLSVRRVLTRTLERHGWTALQAHDGVEALEIVQAGGIDIVVTDIEMPRMDGFELISALRRGEATALPIVVLTSRSSTKHRDKAFELGANAYIVKPFQEQELIQTLERETVAIRAAG